MEDEHALYIARLIAGHLKQELTPEEETELQRLLSADEANRQLLERYRDTASAQERIAYMDGLDIAADWDRVARKRNAAVGKRGAFRLRWLAYAASTLMVIGTATWWMGRKKDAGIVQDPQYGYRNDVLPGNEQATLTLSDGSIRPLGTQAVQLREKDGTRILGMAGELNYAGTNAPEGNLALYNTLNVPKAGFYRIILPDSSRAWVNSLSSLRFPTRFEQGERRVILTGEAYFEVAKKHAHPFIVAVNGKEIQVLGTSFNVSAYGEVTTTTLIEGSVKVTDGGVHRLLRPGQQAVATTGKVIVAQADIEKATAWKTGFFHFSGDSIQTIMEQLARWYDLEISYLDTMPAKRFGGSISRQATLANVLEMLKDVSKLEFEIEGRTLRVKTIN